MGVQKWFAGKECEKKNGIFLCQNGQFFWGSMRSRKAIVAAMQKSRQGPRWPRFSSTTRWLFSYHFPSFGIFQLFTGQIWLEGLGQPELLTALIKWECDQSQAEKSCSVSTHLWYFPYFGWWSCLFIQFLTLISHHEARFYDVIFILTINICFKFSVTKTAKQNLTGRLLLFLIPTTNTV